MEYSSSFHEHQNKVSQSQKGQRRQWSPISMRHDSKNCKHSFNLKTKRCISLLKRREIPNWHVSETAQVYSNWNSQSDQSLKWNNQSTTFTNFIDTDVQTITQGGRPTLQPTANQERFKANCKALTSGDYAWSTHQLQKLGHETAISYKAPWCIGLAGPRCTSVGRSRA